MSELEFFVLDEADRMLDMGFKEDVEKVLEAVRAAQKAKEEGGGGSAKITFNDAHSGERAGVSDGGAGAGSVQTILFSGTFPCGVMTSQTK